MNFGDRGALILGPSGMGKTVFLNALLSENHLEIIIIYILATIQLQN